MYSFCLKCKKITETINVTICTSKNKNPRLKGTCVECGSNKSTFLKKNHDMEMK